MTEISTPPRKRGRPRKHPLPAAPPPTKHVRLDVPLDLYAHLVVLRLARNQRLGEVIIERLYAACDVQPLPEGPGK